MARPLFDSPYLFGIHEPGGEQHMIQMGKPGWIVFTEGIGSDPNDRSGKDFTQWSNQGLGILCRLNNGYEPAGTIPHSSRYEQFAQRCANYAAASRGCKLWIIGNEMNHPVERPGVQIDWSRTPYSGDESSRARMVPWRFNARDEETRATRMAIVSPGEVITPQLYARCYRLCRDAIKRVPGHENDQVLVGATAPWNNLTKYDDNPNGDWVQYHADILKLLGAQNCDGITIHTYTHSPDPAEIYTDTYMGPPFQNRQYNFRAYRDFMNATPASMRHLPVYITETDQDVPWLNQNNGWVKRAYGEIDYWNQQPGNQQIRALILYRWPPLDRWVIEGRQGVIEDWRESMRNDYRWRETPIPAPPPAPPAFKVGQTIYVASDAYLRSSPGYSGKPQGDVLATLPVATACTVLAGPEMADGLDWWQVRCTVDGQTLTGWVARTTPGGVTLLSTRKPPTPVQPTPPTPPAPEPPAPSAPFKVGDKVWNTEVLNLRRTAGFQSKPDNDVIYEIPAGSQLTIINGPQAADGLTWWGVRFVSQFGNRYDGWVAGAKASGAPLLVTTPPTPGEPPTPPTPTPQPPTPVEPPTPPAPTTPVQVGKLAVAQAPLELRRSPGAAGKPANDVMYVVPTGGEVMVLDGPRQADGVPWWRVRYVSRFGNPFIGWTAERNSQGTALLLAPQTPIPPTPPPEPPTPPTPTPEPPTPPPAPPGPALSKGMKATTTGIVNLRRSPGFKDKPSNDILYEIPAGSELTVLGGPQTVDGLTWWNVRFSSQFGNNFTGWVAATKASGEPLLVAGAAPAQPDPTTPVTPPANGRFQPGQRVYAASFLNLRRTPGYVNKTADDVLVEAPFGAPLTILGGPQKADDLQWWQVRFVDSNGRSIDGWAAEASSKGVDYLVTTQPTAPTPTGPLPTKTFEIGNVVANAYTDPLNVRRSPGYVGKDNNSDIVAKLPRNAPVVITEGPRQLDDLQWWRIAGAVNGAGVDGWVAEIGPKGQRFLIPAQLMGKINLGKPFEGNWRVTQLMADRPEVYKKFSYDGVPLRGHNGVDFGTPNGTKLLATDDGEVVQVGYEASGFGNFAKLSHVWGESVYAHMQKVSVKEGDEVKRGDVLGLADNTGNSSGPHLHFGVRILPNKRGDGWGGYHDPIPFMNPNDVIIPDNIRAVGAEPRAPGMTPDDPARERP